MTTLRTKPPSKWMLQFPAKQWQASTKLHTVPPWNSKFHLNSRLSLARHSFRKKIAFRKVVCLRPFDLLLRSEHGWKWVLSMDVSAHTIYTNSSFRGVCMCVCFSEWMSEWVSEWMTYKTQQLYSLDPIFGCCATKEHTYTGCSRRKCQYFGRW